MKAIVAALISLASFAIATPVVELASAKLDCPSIPSEANDGILVQVYRLSKARGVTDKVLLATFETCWVESHCNNLPCGDQDSIGVFQQRPSQGWGTYDQIMNVDYSTNKFLDECIRVAAANPNARAGTIAQLVQRSEFPDRYNENEAKANALIQRASQLAGPGVPGGSCRQFYTVVSGDICFNLAQRFGITVAQLISWNPAVNAGCTNLAIGQQLCVSK